MSEKRILIVEDDNEIRECVRILLESEKYQVEEAMNGEEALQLLENGTDLVILDVMMPDMSGVSLCKKIRTSSNVPVLFLTAKAQESDKLIGLMAGGDDYLTKPFSYGELLGRVKALLRRYTEYKGKDDRTRQPGDVCLESGRIRINETSNEVFKDGELIDLSSLEYQILLLMMRNPRKVFSSKNLYESVWKEPFLLSSNNTVMVHIWRIRAKIEDDPKNPSMIKTIWGRGYRFDGNR